MTSKAPAANPLGFAQFLAGDLLKLVAADRRRRAQQRRRGPDQQNRLRRVSSGLHVAGRADRPGRLDTKIATSRARLTPAPPAIPMPNTACSGMPSNNAPSASDEPADCWAQPPIAPHHVGEVEDHRPSAMPMETASAPATRKPSSANSNEMLATSAPAPKPRTNPTRREFQSWMTPATAPMTNEDAATNPHDSAVSTSGA